MALFVVGHGSTDGDETFVPTGTVVHFFAPPDTDLQLHYALHILGTRATDRALLHFTGPVTVPNVRLSSYTWEHAAIFLQAGADGDIVVGTTPGWQESEISLCDGNCAADQDTHDCAGLLGRVTGELYVVCCLGSHDDESPPHIADDYAATLLEELEEVDRLKADDPDALLALMEELNRTDPRHLAVLMADSDLYEWALCRQALRTLNEPDDLYEFYALFCHSGADQLVYLRNEHLREAVAQVEREIATFRYASLPRRRRIWSEYSSRARAALARVDDVFDGFAP